MDIDKIICIIDWPMGSSDLFLSNYVWKHLDATLYSLYSAANSSLIFAMAAAGFKPLGQVREPMHESSAKTGRRHTRLTHS